MNLNLKNDVAAANDRSLNLKDNYMKSREDMNQINENLNKRVDELGAELNTLIAEQKKELNLRLNEQAEVLNIQILDANTNKRLEAVFQSGVQNNNTRIEGNICQLFRA